MPKAKFTTNKSSNSDQHEAWLSAGSPKFGDIFDATPEPGFEAHTTTVYVGAIRIIFGWYGAQSISRDFQQIAEQPLNDLLIGLSGSMTTEGPMYRAGPKELLFLDYSQPFSHNSSAGSLITLTIPRSLASSYGIDPTMLHGWIVRSVDASLLRALLFAIEDIPETAPGQADHLASALMSLIAAAMAKSFPFFGLHAKEVSAALKLRAEQIIEAGAEDLRVDVPFLCRALAISRSTLYNLYRNDGGVLRRIRRERLHAAKAILRSTDRAIGALATDLGFHDSAHFARAFREEFGVSPREWRVAG